VFKLIKCEEEKKVIATESREDIVSYFLFIKDASMNKL
jgi:hypothetical protein